MSIKLKVLLGGLAVLVGISLILVLGDKDQKMGANPVANTSGESVALIGSITGTTTTGVAFSNYSNGTTTYPFLINADVRDASIFLRLTGADSYGAGYVSMALLSSNDRECDTASTTAGVLNNVITSDINWYDASQHVANVAGSVGVTSASSSITWTTPVIGEGREIVLENLNTKCLALQVNSSSTVIYAEFTTR